MLGLISGGAYLYCGGHASCSISRSVPHPTGKRVAVAPWRNLFGAPAVQRKPKAELDLAIRQCLTRCYRTDFPLTCLAQFSAELKQRGWHDYDIHATELAVLRLLAGVMGRERESM